MNSALVAAISYEKRGRGQGAAQLVSSKASRFRSNAVSGTPPSTVKDIWRPCDLRVTGFPTGPSGSFDALYLVPMRALD